MLGNQPPGQTNGSVGPLLGRGQGDLHPVGADDFPPFDRDGAAHHDFDGIAFDDADDGQSDARIARCWLDDGLPRAEAPFAFGLLNHLERDAVLDAARGVESFEFGPYFDVGFAVQPVDAYHRRIADGFQNVILHHWIR